MITKNKIYQKCSSWPRLLALPTPHTYIVRSEALVRRHRDLIVVGVDLVALERGHPLVSGIIDGYHDICVREQCQLHGFFKKTAFPFVKTYLFRSRLELVILEL